MTTHDVLALEQRYQTLLAAFAEELKRQNHDPRERGGIWFLGDGDHYAIDGEVNVRKLIARLMEAGL